MQHDSCVCEIWLIWTFICETRPFYTWYIYTSVYLYIYTYLDLYPRLYLHTYLYWKVYIDVYIDIDIDIYMCTWRSHTADIHMTYRICMTHSSRYGVATVSRMLKNIGLFCKRDLQKRPIFCKETYIFKHPTNRSHPIVPWCERYVSTWFEKFVSMWFENLCVLPSNIDHISMVCVYLVWEVCGLRSLCLLPSNIDEISMVCVCCLLATRQ